MNVFSEFQVNNMEFIEYEHPYHKPCVTQEKFTFAALRFALRPTSILLPPRYWALLDFYRSVS